MEDVQLYSNAIKQKRKKSILLISLRVISMKSQFDFYKEEVTLKSKLNTEWKIVIIYSFNI